MLPCHVERRLSIDPDGGITALNFYDWKGTYHHVFLHTNVSWHRTSDLDSVTDSEICACGVSAFDVNGLGVLRGTRSLAVRARQPGNEVVSVECALIRAIVIYGEIINGCGVTSDLAWCRTCECRPRRFSQKQLVAVTWTI
jgi:hypothetical protein